MIKAFRNLCLFSHNSEINIDAEESLSIIEEEDERSASQANTTLTSLDEGERRLSQDGNKMINKHNLHNMK